LLSQALVCSCARALHPTALHPTARHPTALNPSAARYPLLSIGATCAESIGVPGAAHLQLRLDRKWLTTPLDLLILQLANVLSLNTQPTQPGMYSFFGSSFRFLGVGRLEGHGITVLGFLCPRRSCSGRSSCAQFLFAPLWVREYCAVKRPMEASSHSGIHALGSQISSSTSASFLAYVFVDCIILTYIRNEKS
jgi:hypothetical protein